MWKQFVHLSFFSFYFVKIFIQLKNWSAGKQLIVSVILFFVGTKQMKEKMDYYIFVILSVIFSSVCFYAVTFIPLFLVLLIWQKLHEDKNSLETLNIFSTSDGSLD